SSRGSVGSAAGTFRAPATAGELLDEPVTVVTLDFDAVTGDRSTRAAAFLELRRELLELRGRQTQAADDGYTLALAALRFPADAYGAIGPRRRAGRTAPAHALAYRSEAVRAALPDAGRVDDATFL